jgi:hypothetical protein
MKFWISLRKITILNLVTSILLILIGCATIWVGYEAFQHVFITTLELEYIAIIIISVGSGLAVVGIVGVFASWYKRRSTLLAFIIVVGVLCLALLGGGAFTLYFRSETD